MRKSKLIQLLKKMKKNEFSRLEQFVHSPFFNNNKEITSLFDYLKDGYPHFQLPKLTKELFFTHLFPDQAYDGRKMIYLMSDTYKLVLDFLAQIEYQTNIVAQKKLKAEGLRKKGMVQEYYKELSSTQAVIIKNPVKDLDYFSDLYYLEAKRYTSGLSMSLSASKKSLEAVMDYLDKFYAMGKLQFGTEMVSRRAILGEDYGEILFFEKMKKVVEVGFGKENPMIELFYLIIQLLETNEEKYYWELKNLFFEKQAVLHREDKTDILTYLVNYTVNQNKVEKAHFTKESFELCKFGFINKIFSEFIPNNEHMFQNLILNGCILKEFAWIDDFMALLGKVSNKKYSEDVINFAKANIMYYKKDYLEARKLLLNNSFRREPDKVRTKAMLVRILYEEYVMDDSVYPLLLSTLQAFRRFLLRNKKLPHFRIVPYLNFLKYTKELSRHHFNRRVNERIKTRLAENVLSQKVSGRDWLIEKIQSL